ncbi:hypothetical protein WMY93_022518 [Mugilogobius chulae]|uniref:Coiled-coil domain containing 122 n=1 Tax=Mugilogobius chulae TaxID=88201 RepID=A0AAW0NJI6_9GOBI
MSVDNGSKGSEFTLSKVVEDVSQHSLAQTEALNDKQKTLLSLESDVEHLEQQTQELLQRSVNVSHDIADLQSQIKEEQEKVSAAQAQYKTYRTKMEEHRAAVVLAASQTEAHRELEERRARVRVLREKKEELREDLENPNGNAVQAAKSETSALKEQIIGKKKAIAEKRSRLRKEVETHSQIKKEIEIQNRRYEAIVKRLHCQLSKAQAVHRQMSAEVYHMERQISELKRQLDTCQHSK